MELGFREKFRGGRLLKLKIPIYNNAWFDNGVVMFYELLKLIESKGNTEVNSKLSSGRLSISIPNTDKFAKELAAEIRNNRKNVIVNQKKRKHQSHENKTLEWYKNLQK